MQFSPDGSRILTASPSRTGTAQVWDAETGKPLTEPLKHTSGVWSAQFSPDGKRIVTASRDRTARVWDAQTGQLLTEPMKHGACVNSAQFSPDGKQIVTGSEDKTARMWDAQTGRPLTDPLKHGGGVRSAQFSPDGKRIVTASQDGTARVWDIAPSGTGFPDWLLELAEAVAGGRLNPQGVLEATGQDPASVIGRIRQQLAQAPTNDDWVVWGRWFLADRATRTISPFSKVTMAEHLKRQAE
jgi:dipeptidyl aminopeptidase/acylaminoacyl peptidase